MPRRALTFWNSLGSSVLLTCLASVGCAGNSPVDLANFGEIAGAGLGATVMTGPFTSLSAPAIYRWEIDPGSLTATSALLTSARAGQDNDGRFLLPLDNFLRPDHLRMERVRRTEDSLEIDYRFTHPFASSEISNRADLGFSGFLLFLTDVDTATGNTFYNDRGEPVILNREAVTNAHAFWSPGELLSLNGITANTFPYQLIVNDGSAGNRVDPLSGDPNSNGGIPTGNYDPTVGWFGLQGDSRDWTGFDVLHQGQAAVGTLRLSREALRSAGPVSLDVAVIAKYADPKSAAPGFEHRLPSLPPDVLNEFGYRYPYGALDVSRITWEGQTANFVANTTSVAEINFHIRDWDARATPTSNLIAEVADPMQVPMTEVGGPNIYWSCPALYGPDHHALLGNIVTNDDSAFGGDPEQDSGRAGDALFYELGAERVGVPADVRGSYPALVQFLDQGAFDQPTIFLDSELQPLPGEGPRNTTYWPIDVKMDSQLGAGWARQITGNESESIRDIAVGPDGQVWGAGIYNSPTDFGGGVRTSTGSFDCFALAFDPEGNYLWDRTWGSASYDEVGGVAVRTDGIGALITSTFADTMTFEGTPYSQINGDGFLLQLDSSGTTSTFDFVASNGNDQVLKPTSTGTDLGFYICGYLGTAADISGTPVPTTDNNTGYTARLDEFNGVTWVRTYPITGTAVSPQALTVLTSGAVITTGGWLGVTDFGGGSRSSTLYDIFVVRHAADGAYVWDRTFGGVKQDFSVDIASGFGGRIVFVGNAQGPIDFGGGIHPVPADGQSGFVVSLTAGGVYQWSQMFDHSPAGGSRINGVGILPGDGGDLMIGGTLNEDLTFASLPFDPTVNNAFYARLEASTGVGVYAAVLNSAYQGEIECLTLGPEETVYYGLRLSGATDVEPGTGETTLTAPPVFDEIGVVKLYADNTW